MNAFAQALNAALNYAVVSRQVSDEGEAVGFLYREEPAFEHDSGWRFFSGAESDEYADNPDHFVMMPLNKVTERYPELLPLMQYSEGAWEWDDSAECFVAAGDWQPQ